MKKSILSFFLTMVCYFAIAQTGSVYNMIQTEHQSQSSFTEVNVFRPNPSSVKTNSTTKDVLTKGSILEINSAELLSVRNAEAQTMTLNIPTLELSNVELELVKVNIFSEGFSVVTSDGSTLDGDLGVHYHGIIKGDKKSLAAISIYENEISGFFSNADGNYVIGKLEKTATGEHVVYNDRNMIPEFSAECGTVDDLGFQYRKEEISPNPDPFRTAGDCLRIYIEVNTDIYNNKGANTQSFVTAFFNQSAVIYSNESLTIGISEIYIWTTTSPYNGTNSGTLLGQFQGQYSNSNPFNGDIGHMISYSGGGGIAAGFSAICNPEIDNRMCFSGIQSSYSNVPTYSWTVQVFTHEMGHLFGCRHTHACVWNGNNTAIDGCYTTEGGCASPAQPSNGGTTMSYCHLQSVGINMSLGFGPQPGDVMRYNVANAGCFSSTCDGLDYPTCEDGVQNGYETGVDCGGTACPACPCSGNQVEITILPDTYPGETSWAFLDANGDVYVSAGPFSYAASNTEFSQIVCLPNGCYDFVIYDSYGDGLFDGTNNGTYTVTEVSNNNILASGAGNFGASETTNFCVNGGLPPTCDDGIQNQDETGVDCGGVCPDVCPPSCDDGIQNQGETGIDCGGPNCAPCCTDMTLSILFDSWPSEISWSIVNSAGTTVESFAYPDNALANQTDTRTFCLPDDCYVFTINDSYGDGLYDTQNTGNYSLVDDSGNTLSSATGNFGSSNTDDFCVPVPTCSDGVMNGDETGIDCGGSCPNDCPVISGIYVDETATGANDGSSWADAYTDLQDALAVGANMTIHIAEGTYLPTSGTQRGTSFDIPTGATLLGGYPSGGAATRDADANLTTLSGDIDGVPGYAGNSYHVVKLSNVTDVTLDGLDIKDGSADSSTSFGRARGGGIYSVGSSCTITNTTIRRNKAVYGGGMFATLSPNITLNGCEIKLNEAGNGAALYHSNQTNMYINSCTILGNNSTIRCAIEVNNSLFTEINNSVIADNVSKNANAIGFIATNRDQSCNIYNTTILGEAKDRALLSIQTGNNDVLDLNIYNSIIAHQNASYTKNVVIFNNGTLNFTTTNCYVQGASIAGTTSNNLYEDTAGDLMLNSDYSLDPCSPAVNAGNNANVNSLPVDIAGNARIFDNTVDIGAYEAQTLCTASLRETAANTSSFGHKVKVYPNPATNVLYIKTSLENFNVEMYDVLGKLVKSTDNTNEVNISNLNEGVYIMNVFQNGKLMNTQRIVKR